MKRRDFLSLTGQAMLGALAGSGMLQAISAGKTCLVNRQTVRMAGLAPAFEGVRIAVLSDFHYSPWIHLEYIRKVVEMTNALQPDIVALLGDYVHRDGRRWAAGIMRELADLRAPYGIFGAIGNHDHYGRGIVHVRNGLRQAGIEVLENSAAEIRRGDAVLHLGGVADYWHGKPRLLEAIGNAATPSSVVLLSHNPDYAEHIRDERIGLVLSGHTHGGQCVFPVIGAPFTSSAYGSKYLAGLCQAPATPIFVTRGVGASYPAVRIGAPAEVALLTLTRGKNRFLL